DSPPASRWRRHADRWEEYSPSRRRIAPTSPAWPRAVASSTSLRMRCLYSAVKPRRVAFAKTSVSLTEGAATTGFIVQTLVALYTKLPCQDCLTDVDTEGIESAAGFDSISVSVSSIPVQATQTGGRPGSSAAC